MVQRKKPDRQEKRRERAARREEERNQEPQLDTGVDVLEEVVTCTEDTAATHTVEDPPQVTPQS